MESLKTYQCPCLPQRLWLGYFELPWWLKNKNLIYLPLARNLAHARASVDLTIFSLLGRCLVSFRCYYHYNYQYETTSSLSIPNTTICVISTNHSQITSIPPSPDCWNYHATNRSLSKHHFFQPCRKRRPYPISTPALVLWPPRGLQSHSTKLCNNFTHCYLLIR